MVKNEDRIITNVNNMLIMNDVVTIQSLIEQKAKKEDLVNLRKELKAVEQEVEHRITTEKDAMYSYINQ